MTRRMVSEIAAGVYQVGGSWGSGIFGANIYLVVDDDVTLIDTGFKGRLKSIVDSVNGLSHSLSDIVRIVITHHHPDHTGNLAKLKELTGAKVIAHGGDAPYIDGTFRQPGPQRPTWLSRYLTSFDWPWTLTPVGVDIVVEDGDVLPLLGGARIIHTPGHTPGSICLWLERKKLLIVGDLLANRFGLRLPALMFTVDVAQEVRSINKILAFDFEVICFGHGPPIREHARDAVARFADRVVKRYLR